MIRALPLPKTAGRRQREERRSDGPPHGEPYPARPAGRQRRPVLRPACAGCPHAGLHRSQRQTSQKTQAKAIQKGSILVRGCAVTGESPSSPCSKVPAPDPSQWRRRRRACRGRHRGQRTAGAARGALGGPAEGSKREAGRLADMSQTRGKNRPALYTRGTTVPARPFIPWQNSTFNSSSSAREETGRREKGKGHTSSRVLETALSAAPPTPARKAANSTPAAAAPLYGRRGARGE